MPKTLSYINHVIKLFREVSPASLLIFIFLIVSLAQAPDSYSSLIVGVIMLGIAGSIAYHIREKFHKTWAKIVVFTSTLVFFLIVILSLFSSFSNMQNGQFKACFAVILILFAMATIFLFSNFAGFYLGLSKFKFDDFKALSTKAYNSLLNINVVPAEFVNAFIEKNFQRESANDNPRFAVTAKQLVILESVLFIMVIARSQSAPVLPPTKFNPTRSYQSFKGYECTDDCSGHRAGYKWAEVNNIHNLEECRGNSRSFIEGCMAYVLEGMSNE